MILPPLTALRAFEAAARTGSYVEAGREIGVTPAAISQHVRKLEEALGKQLFVRMNNRVMLTDAGHMVFEGAHAGLLMIAEAIRPQTARRARIVISCIESVADKWLVGRLAAYAGAHGDFRFDLRIESDPVDLAGQGIDLRLGYDPAHYPRQETVTLGHDVVQPLCSPGYLARRPAVQAEGMAAVPAEDLIDVDWGPSFGSRPGWEAWFAAAALPPPGPARGSRIGSSAVAIDLARAGLGVVLGQRLVAAADLAGGGLLALSPVALPLRHAYCLAFPRPSGRRRHVADLAKWLQRQWVE